MTFPDLFVVADAEGPLKPQCLQISFLFVYGNGPKTILKNLHF